MASTLFKLSQLGFSYRAAPVLRGVNWTWIQGEHWAVLGANGAGKTALANIIAGSQTHFSGTYERSASVGSASIAYVCFERGLHLCERDRKLDCSEFESSGSDIGTRVRDLLGDDDSREQRRSELIALLNIESILDRGLRYISTGEMRKALLASALLDDPALLILDSPMDGLDLATQQRLGEVLNSIIENSPAVMVLCRSLEEIPDACSHIMLLEDGRQRIQGVREKLETDPSVLDALAPPDLAFKPLNDSRPTSQSATLAPETIDDHQPTFELRDVSVSFGDLCVFRDLNWRFERDQHCLIAGPNGSGKSTLLDLLTGDNHKAYGQDVSLFGRRRGTGESVWEIKSRFGRVDARMQNAVPNGSRVLDVVASGFFDSVGLYDQPSDVQRRTAMDWLRALDMGSWADREYHTLSFGLKRLALLGRAMVKNPSILLLDEATLSLDGGHRKLLLEAVDHVIDHSSCQLLFVSHTAGERPKCINQALTFEPGINGSTITVRDLADR